MLEGLYVVTNDGYGQFYVQEDATYTSYIEGKTTYAVEQVPGGNYVPIKVQSDLKCGGLQFACDSDIEVSWPGEFPFEFKRYYNNDLRFFNYGLSAGWTMSYYYRLQEDVRYNYETTDESCYGSVPIGDENYIGIGDIYITYPNGAKRLFRYDRNDSGFQPLTPGNNVVTYRPYPEDDSGDRIERVTHLYGNPPIEAEIAYAFISRDGTVIAFDEFTAANHYTLPAWHETNYGYPLKGGTIFWSLDTGASSIADKYGNTLGIEWTTDNYVGKVFYDKDGSGSHTVVDEPVIDLTYETVENCVDYGWLPIIGSQGRVCTSAKLKINGTDYRSVEYEYDRLCDLCSWFYMKTSKKGTLADKNGDASVNSYVETTWYLTYLGASAPMCLCYISENVTVRARASCRGGGLWRQWHRDG